MTDFILNILSSIGETGEYMVDIMFTFMTTPYGKLRPNTPVSSFYSALQRLDKQKVVKKRKKGKKNIYFLTPKGRSLLKKRVPRKKRSDGLNTIVIFDIPEQKKRQRGIFRRYLKNNGYLLLQKSVLIGSDELNEELKDLIKELDIRNHVSILDGKIRYDF